MQQNLEEENERLRKERNKYKELHKVALEQANMIWTDYKRLVDLICFGQYKKEGLIPEQSKPDNHIKGLF